MVKRTRTKSTRVTKFLKKLAKESIPRFVSQEEAAVAPQKFKSRRHSLPQPVAGFELAIHSGQRYLNLVAHVLQCCSSRTVYFESRSLFARFGPTTPTRAV